MHATNLGYLLLGVGLACARELNPTVYENVGAERYAELLESNHAVLTSCKWPNQLNDRPRTRLTGSVCASSPVSEYILYICGDMVDSMLTIFGSLQSEFIVHDLTVS